MGSGMFNLVYTEEAKKNLLDLKKQGQIAKLKKIKVALDKLAVNPRYSGLHTHKNESFIRFSQQEIFQSYVENHTSSAYRIFWCYGPEKDFLTIVAIVPHP